MSLLWALPAMVVAVGIGFLAVALRRSQLAAVELADQVRRFEEVRVAVAATRAEARLGREAVARHRRR